MKELVKLAVLGSLGVIMVYSFLKKPSEQLPLEEAEFVYLQMPPIYLPANIPEETINEVAEKLGNPKVIPTISPAGWKIEWPPIQIDLPVVGQVNISPVSKQLPVMPRATLLHYIEQFRPTVERTDLLWKLTFPALSIQI